MGSTMETSYHYIVIGAGSAGCVLGNRLSADPSINVLLVESGPSDNSMFIHMPRGLGILLSSGNKHVSVYEVSQGANRPTETWPKGRTLGGSSSINGMVYMRGAPRDFDSWEAEGCAGWGWETMRRHFIELEDHQLGAGPDRGVGGPLKITVSEYGDQMSEAIIAGAGELGVSRVRDLNDMPAVNDGGFGYQPATIYHGSRYSAADAFLHPIKHRSNLTVVTETHARQILFDGDRAIGVRLHDHRGDHDVMATGEVILCAGALETPKLLQLSGIGPRDLLASLGIAVVADSSDVGRNLIEHRGLQLKFRSSAPSQNEHLIGIRLVESVIEYGVAGKGPMTHAATEVGGYIKTDPSFNHPDVQICVSLYSLADGGPKDGAAAASLDDSAPIELPQIAVDDKPGCSVAGYFTQPKSRGELRIVSADPDVAPFINANYLTHPDDRQHAIGLVRWVRRLMQTNAVQPLIVEELAPVSDCQTDDEIIEAMFKFGTEGYHVAGTCRMGSDEDSVVDPRLRVRGVSGLRIMDTSVMPTLTSGNTNAPTLAMALRAAELILEDRVLQPTA